MRLLSVTLLAALLVLVPSLASGQESAGEFHRFHASVLVGDTHGLDHNGFTFGGDVEFRPLRRVGFGVTGEHVNKPFRENVWVLGVNLHPARGLRLTVGPGFERESFEHHTAQHGLVRVGAAYEIPLAHGWTLDPDVAVDFIGSEHVTVYAVAIGKEFGRVGH